MDSLEQRGALQLVPYEELPPNAKLLPTTTVVRIKTDAHGNPYARKARCNVRGDRQKPTILALAGTNNYAAHNWDLDEAVFHELLAIDLPHYIHQTKTFEGM